MSKILEASCVAGVVTADGSPVPDVEVLSLGVAESEGLLVLDGELKKYLPSSATDIEALITSLVSIIEQITLIATGLDGVTNSPGAQAANITQLTTLKTALNTSKGNLK